SGSGRGMRPSANALASSVRFWGKVQGAGRCGCGWRKAPRTRSAGQDGLRYHFEIANAYTDHTLQVGSHCILQFNLTVYDEDGWRLSPKDARKKLVRLTKQLRLESYIRALEKLARVEDYSDILKTRSRTIAKTRSSRRGRRLWCFGGSATIV